MVHSVFQGITINNCQTLIACISLVIDLVLANSADPDEMPRSVAFYLGIHCLQTYPFKVFQSTKGEKYF